MILTVGCNPSVASMFRRFFLALLTSIVLFPAHVAASIVAEWN